MLTYSNLRNPLKVRFQGLAYFTSETHWKYAFRGLLSLPQKPIERTFLGAYLHYLHYLRNSFKIRFQELTYATPETHWKYAFSCLHPLPHKPIENALSGASTISGAYLLYLGNPLKVPTLSRGYLRYLKNPFKTCFRCLVSLPHMPFKSTLSRAYLPYLRNPLKACFEVLTYFTSRYAFRSLLTIPAFTGLFLLPQKPL